MPNVHTLTVSFCLGLFVVGCNSAHTPGSTETGNPPVIDIGRVALVVTSNEVRIVGQPGAVTPGGASVEINVVGTNESATSKAAPDGSFEFQVDEAGAVIEVRASSGGEDSETVYVTRGGASVGMGESGELSCDQRISLARQSFPAEPDTSCETAADCVAVDFETLCTALCGPNVISKKDAAGVQAAVSAANAGVCRDFEAAGCTVIIPPCAPPAPADAVITCINGSCGKQTL